uniref:C-type lectin domain-containing protein n=1 Tax=Sander lucioperca TaxID=283035 RepID=A0A8C9Z2U5_SANLU
MFWLYTCTNNMFFFVVFSAHCHCQQGWREYNNKCYFFSTDTKSWMEANAYCMGLNTNLMSIQDIHERVRSCVNDFLIQLSPTGISLWMGGHDSVTEGGWEWSDGSPFRYIRWSTGNPDDYYGEDCLSILINNGYWNDDNCESKRGYICKRKGKICCFNFCCSHLQTEDII